MTATAPRRRIVSLSLPRFATDRAARRAEGTGDDVPLATIAPEAGAMRLAAVDAQAASLGLIAGMPLAEARARVPALVAIDADGQGDARVLERLAAWCCRYTPWTSLDPCGGTDRPGAAGLWLDISGCAHLFGGEARLLMDLAERLANAGYAARAAAADTAGAAWARARHPRDEGETGWTRVSPGEQAAAIAPLPLAALRLEPETREGLNRMGVRRVAELQALPRGPLAARFGEAPLRRLEQALGTTDEPVSPIQPVPELRTRLVFPEPIGTPEDITAATGRLVAALASRLEERAAGARRLRLVCYRADGTLAEIRIGTGRAEREPKHLMRLFREKFDHLDPGFGIDAMALEVHAADSLAPVQESFEAAGRSGEALSRLVDRLGNRLGHGRVHGLEPRPRHVPEHAQAVVPPLSSQETADRSAAPAAPLAPRPVHLLAQPEPIEVVAPVPDRPPVQFRWRRRLYRIARADGPERIGPEWWLGDPAAIGGSEETEVRDYFRIEDTAGQRFWVYRRGLYCPGLPPQWFLQGMFA